MYLLNTCQIYTNTGEQRKIQTEACLRYSKNKLAPQHRDLACAKTWKGPKAGTSPGTCLSQTVQCAALSSALDLSVVTNLIDSFQYIRTNHTHSVQI